MANGKSLQYSIDEKSLADLAQALASFSAAAEALRKRITALFSAKYGSSLWWEQSIEQSKKDIAEGRYKSFHSAKDLVRYLDLISS